MLSEPRFQFEPLAISKRPWSCVLKKKNARRGRLVVLATVLAVGYLCGIQPFVISGGREPADKNAGGGGGISLSCRGSSSSQSRHLLTTDQENNSSNNTAEESKGSPLIPEDLFTKEERQNGAVVLHIMGMIYMFVALAIVCDEFFIPALDIIIEKLDIQEDVAGATFMAAGGSAPELFTSVISVFFSIDNVGIGTIVGSAVFNILFVIGMCAVFSKSVLNLTWWPLFRDVTFYSVSLIVLIACFLDSFIKWWEALSLLLIYVAYVYVMSWNVQLERFVKKHITKNRVARVSSADQLVTSAAGTQYLLDQVDSGRHPSIENISRFASVCEESPVRPHPHLKRSIVTLNGAAVVTKAVPVADTFPSSAIDTATLSHRRASTPIIHAGSKFRHGLLQLMIHSIDPLNEDQEGRIDEKATQIHAIASLKVLLDATRTSNAVSTTGTTTTTTGGGSDTDSQDTSTATVNAAITTTDQLESGQCSRHEADNTSESEFHQIDSVVSITGDKGIVTTQSASQLNHISNHVSSSNGVDSGKLEEVEEGKHPLDFSWPPTARKRLTFVVLMPIILPLWLTLPDTRRPEKKKFFVWTFVGSILWIAAFSYLMVWWATVAGSTLGIPNEVMGLTFLAAGTSIPDLITSVIVARKGFGDMAVSSSIGSNIFDVTVGLPLPWFLYGIFTLGAPVKVTSQGMACSIVILFLMLLFVIVTIACFRWKMNKGLGVSMFILYFAFLAVSLLFEFDIWRCPFYF